MRLEEGPTGFGCTTADGLSDHTSRMSIRRKPRRVLVAVSILVSVAALFIKFTAYDALRLAWFAHRIAESDHIVATNWMSAVSLTIMGEETKKVVRAISSAT